MEQRDSLNLKMAVRSAVGCLLALALAPYFPNFQGLWVMLTMMVLLNAEPRLGAVLETASWRVTGTIIGSLPAVLVAYAFHSYPWALHAGLVILVGAITYWGTGYYQAKPAATVAAVTAGILLYDPSTSPTTSVMRLTSIAVGAILALLCVRFVFPLRAVSGLARARKDCLTALRDYAARLEEGSDPGPELGTRVLTNLVIQQRLMTQALREDRGFDSTVHVQIWEAQRHAFRYLQVLALDPPGGRLQEVAARLESLAQRSEQLGPLRPHPVRLPESVVSYCLERLDDTLGDLDACCEGKERVDKS